MRVNRAGPRVIPIFPTKIPRNARNRLGYHITKELWALASRNAFAETFYHLSERGRGGDRQLFDLRKRQGRRRVKDHLYSHGPIEGKSATCGTPRPHLDIIDIHAVPFFGSDNEADTAAEG